jgi:putative flavoprotein involved in K+ transport
MNNRQLPEQIETVVIGGGQAGLVTGYYLKRRRVPFAIFDANERVGDAWRNRWDSLRLFSPARLSGIDGMKVPAGRNEFITKDEMADYLESYARHHDLPVYNGLRVERLGRSPDGRFEIRAGGRRVLAENVIVAMSNYQCPKIPSFATGLDPAIRQLHSNEYRNPGQLQDGDVLIVGAGNSGAEIAKEVSASHRTWVSGRDVGQLPFSPGGVVGRAFATRLLFRGIFHRVLTTRTPMGRRARPKLHTAPLIRVKGKHLAAAGVERVGPTIGVEAGKPVLDGGRTLDVANVIWCTGFHPGFSWIDLPVMEGREPRHNRGIVEEEPGLYFVGLHFLYSLSSEMIHGVGRDAEYIAKQVAGRALKAAA